MPRRFSNQPSKQGAFKAPAPVRPPPKVSHSGPSMKDSMKQGFGLGLGLEGARAAIGAVGGLFSSGENAQQNSSVHTESTEKSPETCILEQTLFEKCMNETSNMNNECNDIFKLYERCTEKL